ncbi:MAG: D-sedoheptulose 7-phosphate isomerase [Kiritimatiellia bacterium]|nr:D-sedoheptulose 7-phosphate isomerase [Kiritimatiellia bacterium]
MSETIQQSIGVKQDILGDRSFVALIARVASAAVKVFRSGHKIMLAGNGGSAADAQHLAGELVNRFRFDRPALAAIALSTDTSVMTSIANDSSFENIFTRQAEALGVRGDMFIGISTSGSSPNILKALKQCRKMKIISVGLTGQNSAKMEKLCDYCLAVPSENTPRVQEAHIMLGHILCDIIEEALFGAR